MTSTVESLGPCKRRLHIQVPASQIKVELDRSYRHLRDTVPIPGFRVGKTPRSLLERRYGKGVLEDVKNDLMVNGVSDAVTAQGLKVVSQPTVEPESVRFAEGADLEFDVVVEVHPEFELPIYKGIEVTYKTPVITDEDVEKVIHSLTERFAEMHPVEGRSSRAGDLVFGHLSILIDGEVAHEEDPAWVRVNDEQHVYGVPCEKVSDLFSSRLIDSEVSFDATLPDYFHVENLRGKAATVRFRVTEIKETVHAELDVEMANKFGAESPDDLRRQAREHLTIRGGEKANQEALDGILRRIADQTNFELPEQHLERAIEADAMEDLYRMGRAGSLPDEEATLRSLIPKLASEPERRSAVADQMRLYFILDAIAAKEKIFVTDDDYMERVSAMARSSNKKTAEVLARIEEEDISHRIRSSIRERKVIHWLLANSKITDETGAPHTIPTASEIVSTVDLDDDDDIDDDFDDLDHDHDHQCDHHHHEHHHHAD